MRNTFINTFFISLFYSLLLVWHYVTPANWTIHDWNGVISWATAEDIDIGRRIKSFYKGFAAFFTWFFILLTVLHNYGSKLFSELELRHLNNLALAGSMLLFFRLLGAAVEESISLVVVMQLMVVTYALADFLISGFERKQSLPVLELAWALAMGMSAFFLLDYVMLLLHYDMAKHFNKWLFGLGAVALHFCFWLRRRENSNGLCRWMITFRYAALIPALLVLAGEKYMILNQHNIFSIHAGVIFLLLLFIVILLMERSRRKVRNMTEAEEQAVACIANFYFPWLIVGLISFSYYRPVIAAPAEMFEQANSSLSIQQYYEFGKLPWLQTFSSHSGADFITGFIYTAFNGFSGLSYHCYDFLVTVIYVLLMYFTIKKLTGNPYLAILSVLLYPYINLLIPQFHSFMLIPLLILAATINAPSTKNYFFLFSSLILMPFWRYDLGYGVILSLPATMLIFMFFQKRLRTGISTMRNGFLYALLLPALLLIVALVKNHQSLFINLHDALGYLNSAQAFGLKGLGSENTLIYYVQYFVSPFMVAVCLLFAIYRLSLLTNKEERASFSVVSVIFLSIYFFANFHRGLIRHNLEEGWDTAFSSFSFLIVTITAFDFLKTGNKTMQLAAVCAFSSLIILEFKYPPTELSKNNYYSDVSTSIHNHVLATISDVKVNRAIESPAFARETFNDLKIFLDKNIASDATFLDFSNTPMLYFYTHRQTPNYFNQIPHTALNIYLQQRLLEELRQYKIPVVLFSNSPQQWWDSFDGIPNTYRHYLVAEYIYSHYQPFAIINHHSVWMEKGNALLTENHSQYPNDTLSVYPKDQQLEFLPYVMGKSYPVILNPAGWTSNGMNDAAMLYKKLLSSPSSIDEKNGGSYLLSGQVTNNDANYILIKAKNISGRREDIHLSFANNDAVDGSFSFYLKEDDEVHDYLIRLSTQYNWYIGQHNTFHLTMPGGKCEVTEISLLKGQ